MKQLELIILLNELRALPKECEWAEFKVNNCKPEEIGQCLSALSNSARYLHRKWGYLVFGIEDETHRLVGTEFLPSIEKKGNQELQNGIATQFDPRVDFNIFEFETEGKQFAIIRIDATRDRPVAFRGRAFVRIGSYNKPLTDHPERERKIWHNKDQVIFEKGIAFEKVSSEDVLNLIDYPAFFEMSHLPLPDNRKGIFERLRLDKVIEPKGDKYNITNLGGLLFAKDIEQFETLARRAVRVVFYHGRNRIRTVKEQLGSKGYAVGFEGLIKYIVDQLPTN